MKIEWFLMGLLLIAVAQAVPEIGNVSLADKTFFNEQTATDVIGINATITDANYTVTSVVFSLSNTNITFPVTFDNMSLYSSEINLSTLAGGTYVLLITANNSNGESNLAAREFTIDRDKPYMLVSCAPKLVKQGEKVTCTCVASDSGSGLQPGWGFRGSNAREETTTADKGDKSSTCRATDFAGNFKEAEDNWDVDLTVRGSGGGFATPSVSSGGSSGGGGGGSSKPSNLGWDKLEHKGTSVKSRMNVLPSGKGFNIDVGNPSLNVRSVRFDSEQNNANVVINQLTDTPIGAYTAFEIKTDTKDIENIVVTVRVQKSWLNDNNYGSIYIEHGKEKLKVELKEQLATMNYYTFKTQSFSLFVIRGIEKEEVIQKNVTSVQPIQEAVEKPKAQPTKQPSVTQKPIVAEKKTEPSRKDAFVIMAIVTVVVLAVVGINRYKRSKQQNKKDEKE